MILLYLHQHVFFSTSSSSTFHLHHQHFISLKISIGSFLTIWVIQQYDHWQTFSTTNLCNDCSYTAFTAIKCVASNDIIKFLYGHLCTIEERKYVVKRIPATMSIACIMLHYSLKSLRYRLNKAWNVLCIHDLVRGSNFLAMEHRFQKINTME